MSKAKKVIIVFSFAILFVCTISLNAFALTSTSITFDKAYNGYITGDIHSSLKGSYVDKYTDSTLVGLTFNDNVTNPTRFGASIPFSVVVPDGNYWRCSFNLSLFLYDTAGVSHLVTIQNLAVSLSDTSGTRDMFRYSNSSGNLTYIPVIFSPTSINGDLHFLITGLDTYNYTVKSLVIRFTRVTCQYGLESEFSQQIEKEETENSGNESLNDVQSAVPDKSAGMLSALQSLSNAVSYTGTSAKWTFPQMYIPAINGVTDRINLNSEMEIDFAYWVNQIPQDIRTVISAIATIGLVVFAFKELYGLISYVLTLKGGGNNE